MGRDGGRVNTKKNENGHAKTLDRLYVSRKIEERRRRFDGRGWRLVHAKARDRGGGEHVLPTLAKGGTAGVGLLPEDFVGAGCSFQAAIALQAEKLVV